MNRAAGLAVMDQRVMGLLLDGPMRAAFIELLAIARLGQHGAGDAHMLGLAVVRGTGQCDLLRGEAEAVGGAALDHREALEGLDRRARKHRRRDAAFGGHDVVLCIHHGKGAAMPALDDAAAHDFGDDGVDHGRDSLCGEAARYQAKARSCSTRRMPMAQL